MNENDHEGDVGRAVSTLTIYEDGEAWELHCPANEDRA